MKRVLLDTNILIHREASTVIRQDIGVLFNWLDRLHYTKCIHPLSVEEIKKHKDPKVRSSFLAKLASYNELKTEAPEAPQIVELRKQDKNDNSRIDTSLIKELYAGRVDILVTEDGGLHNKARALKIDDRVFRIDGFLEKVTAENPALVEYKVLAVRQEYIGNIDLGDVFFDSFRRDYPGFDKWFNKKADEPAYICVAEDGAPQAFLYLKLEDRNEGYADIQPPFPPCRRLKIGTFKVTLNGHKLGERFLKIVFDNALASKVDEIYVTIFNKDPEQLRLIALLEEWGFVHHGIKKGAGGDEQVFVRDFVPYADPLNPTLTFPYMSAHQRKFLVPIYPAYHTELLPDSILNNEDPNNFEDNKPNRNALRKVYISRSFERGMKPGDIIVFYRTKAAGGSAYYTSVVTTLGVVEKVEAKIGDLDHFISLCRKRSVFTDKDLALHWNYTPSNRPFVVNFLHTYSFPKRPNLKALMDENIISEAPRGFEQISDSQFTKLLKLAHANQSLIVY